MLRFASRLALTLLLSATAGFCFAQSFRSEGPTLFVNEVPVLTIRSSLSGYRPEQRAELAAMNLESGSPLGAVTAKRRPGGYAVMVGSTVVLSITPAEAAAQRSGMPELASRWVGRLRYALGLPPLKVSESAVRLPGGGAHTLLVIGSRASSATAESADEQIAKASLTHGKLTILATGVGKTNVVISAGGVIQTISVEIRPYAASFPQSMSGSVTGIPASAETVRGAIESAIRTQFTAAPGADWTIGAIHSTSVSTGDARSFVVRVKANAPDCISRDGNVNVVVRNLPLAYKPEDELWYCNDPENIDRPQALFTAGLRADSPARLLYHHVNSSRQILFVKVQVQNESDIPARLVLIPGDSRPDRNPVLAGVQAADQFVRSWMRSSGEVILLPPHTSIPISLRRLYPKQTTSGLCYLRLLPDGPSQVLIRSDAGLPFLLDGRWQAALSSSTPWREVGHQKISHYQLPAGPLSEHIYPNPFKASEMNYEVGGRYGFVRIGQKPIPRKGKGKGLDGNFGVTYQIKAKADNPTDTGVELELVFEASAGYSGGLFIVNGDYVRTPLLLPKEEFQVTRFHLAPSASRSFTITTVPLSGSSYPATLTLRPVRDSMYAGSKSAIGSRKN